MKRFHFVSVARKKPVPGLGGANLRFQANDNSTQEDGFRFETSLTGSAPWVAAGTIGASSGSGGALDRTYSGYAFNTLYYGRTVTFRSGFADSVELTGTAWTKPPLPVTAASAVATGPNSFDVSWTLPATEPIGGYRVYGQQDGAPTFDLMAAVSPGVSTVSVAVLSDNQLYNFRIIPFNGTALESEGAATLASGTTDALPSYYAEVMADSPYRYLRLGDVSGTVAAAEVGTAGTYSPGGVTLGISGGLADDPDTGVLLDGFSGSIGAGADTPGSGARTIEFLAIPGAVTTKFLISNRSSGGSSSGFDVLINNGTGQIYLRFGNGTNSYEIQGPGTAPTDVYRHFALVFTGSIARLYIDGVQIGSDTAYTGTIAGGTVTLGKRNTVFHAGSYDEYAAYNTALSGARILVHATAVN